jgi:uncharacterized surface protein with fasciclin (FAS1) repeats
MKKRSILLWTLSLGLLVGFSACNSNADQTNSNDNASTTESDVDLSGQASVADDVSAPNIVQVAVGSPDHTTLVTAVKAAGLVDVLANNGPFTVFAPTNAAFAKIPKETLDELLLPENKAKLAKIVSYHAAPIAFKGKLLKDGQRMFMATGEHVTITREGDDVFANGSKILGTVDASNGVIHVVDDVLFAPE